MLSLVAAITMLSGVFQTAAAADLGSPNASAVSIESCSVAQPGTLGNPKFGYRPAYIDGVTVVYTNSRNVAATEVRFRIVYAGLARTVVDRSIVASGKKRTREFNIGNVIYTSDAASCRLEDVTFADGTSYVPPAP